MHAVCVSIVSHAAATPPHVYSRLPSHRTCDSIEHPRTSHGGRAGQESGVPVQRAPELDEDGDGAGGGSIGVQSRQMPDAQSVSWLADPLHVPTD